MALKTAAQKACSAAATAVDCTTLFKNTKHGHTMVVVQFPGRGWQLGSIRDNRIDGCWSISEQMFESLSYIKQERASIPEHRTHPQSVLKSCTVEKLLQRMIEEAQHRCNQDTSCNCTLAHPARCSPYVTETVQISGHTQSPHKCLPHIPAGTCMSSSSTLWL